MPQLLGEIINSSNTNFTTLDPVGHEKDRETREERRKGSGEQSRRKEFSEKQKYTKGVSGKENISQLDYGARDDWRGNDDGVNWTRLDSDPLEGAKSFSEEFFEPLPTEKAVLVKLPEVDISSPHSGSNQNGTCHPIISRLRRLSSSKIPSIGVIQDILGSEDLVPSLQEAHLDSLISSIYNVMLRHTNSKEVQILGAQLLQKTAMHVPDAANEIGKGNGIQLIVHSMLLNKDCVAIQTAGSASLAALCVNTQNRIIAGRFYVVEVIVSAAQTFCEEKYLQGACMKLLLVLASEPENMEAVVRAKSMRLPLRVLKRHRQNKTLVRVACECTLGLLNRFDVEDIDDMAQLNPMKLFLCSIVEHPEDERIQTTAIECATVFCRADVACLITCINGRAPDLCVRNLRRYRGSQHGRLHLACLDMLCVFAKAGCQKLIVSAGALEGCLTCMIEMRRVYEMQLCGLRLLELVVDTGEESYLERIVTAGGLDVLSASLKMYISREDFVQRGVRVIRVLRA